MHTTFGPFPISTIKSSFSGKLVASTDINKTILVWNAVTKEVYADNFHFHSARVYSLSWNKSDTLLVSSSLDNSAIVWDIEAKKRINTFPSIDNSVATTTCFYGSDREFVAGGASCSPRIIPVDQDVTIGGKK
jgi:WD repeat-containing protein 1 (actin-interacting protein 1)